MIRDYLTTDSVDVNVEVKDWKEAIIKSGELLVRNNCATEEYIDGMIETVKEYGPYIVVLPQVAISHARPEQGALKIGLSLISLKDGVNFGNEMNDPVRLVFSLCAIDNHSHLELLQEMAILFEDNSNIEALIDSRTKEELVSKIYEITSRI